jgi:penicillin amidase
MATSTAAPSVAPVVRRRGGRRLLRVVLFLLALVVLVGVGVSLYFYSVVRSALPQLDGSVVLAGIHAPVSVTRDAQGVPHISAATLEDLFLAQGYVTAQDRLWQMDLTRRYAGGETSEIFPQSSGLQSGRSRTGGRAAAAVSWLDHDKQQRILRLKAIAYKVAEKLPARDRQFIEAYAKGINTYIEQHRDNLPVEFRVLRYSPKPWTVGDSVLVGLGMSQLLNPQYETEYWRGKVSARLAPELVADLYPASSWRDRPPASAAEDGASTLSVPDDTTPTTEERSSAGGTFHVNHPASDRDCEACVPGSNNWVVSGAHTVTGKPLLSNDMHLGHQLPGVWYEVQLHSGDFNVAGVSLPGLPFVVVGHNQRIAWGFTNLNPDVQDLFVEEFNSAGEYQTPTGWQKPEIDHQIIHVKGQPDVALDVQITRHGPIVTDLLPGETRKIALQWVIYDEKNIGIPLYDVDTAQNWEQFRQAFSKYATPSQNVVYGDVDGHIGYQPMGRVPIRASGEGTMPVSGADGKHDWIGYVPFDELPSLYDPPSGIIATANSRITPDKYPRLLATQWYPPYRTARIYQVLESSKKKFSSADMLALQTDITSEYDRFFVDRFVYAIDHSSKASARVRQAADIMRGFDGRMTADSVAPTIEIHARTALWKKLLEAKLGADWDTYTWSEAAVALESIVQSQPARWLPPGYNNFNDLLTAAVEEALLHAPTDLKSWKYGETFPVEINHPLFGNIPLLNRWTGPGRHPQSGGGYTVKQVGRRFGPSERMTVDFSDLDKSTLNIVIGQSGQLLSPHYMDHWDAWYNNKTFVLPFSDQAVQSAKAHELTLTPAAAK